MIIKGNKHDLGKLKVLIITHSYATGLSQEFAAYLENKVFLLAYVDHPFPFALKKNSSLTVYRKGKLDREMRALVISGPDMLYYFKDFFFTIFFCLRLGERFDFCMAADNLNTLSALVLRKLGKINKVIYHTVDYTPKRFKNEVLNWIYHKIDKICCYKADLVWNSSSLMAVEREKAGIKAGKAAEQIVVPDGNNFARIERLPVEKIDRHSVVFMGHLIESTGVKMLIDAFPEVCTRVKKARLVIIGSGPLEKLLKECVGKLNISGKVTFAGYMESHAELENMMARCGIAVAPYVPDRDSWSFYSDVGKPKAYLACGLPVVITPVPQIAYEIRDRGAGLLVNYEKKDIAGAIIKLLTDEQLYRGMRNNAIELGSDYSWDKVFNRALRETWKRI